MDSKDYQAISTQNKLLSVLIVINLVLVLVALYLFLREDEPSETIINQEVLAQKKEQFPVNKINPVTDAGKTDNESADKQQPASASLQKSLDAINLRLEDIGSLSNDDAAYVLALNNLKKHVESQIHINRPTITDVTARKAKLTDRKQSVDFFNKVNVSQLSTQSSSVSATNSDLSFKIAEILSEPDQSVKTEKQVISSQAKDSYLKNLKRESLERVNEMRTVKVVEGDSLWDIAERAYGDGNEYPRIFKANPGLKDPDLIEVGMLLRVPL